MLRGDSLTAHPATSDRNDHVEFDGIIGINQGPLDQHAVGFVEEVCFEWPVIDSDCARSGSEEYACSGCLSATCSVVLN